MKTRKLLIVMMSLLCATTSYSLELDLNSAIKMAVKHSEDVQIKSKEVDLSTHKYSESKSALLPHANANVTYNRHFGVSEAPSIGLTSSGLGLVQSPIKKDYSVDAGVTVTQTVWTFGQVFNSIQASRKGVEVAKLDQKATKKQVVYNAKVAYYSALLAQKSKDIAYKSYQNAKQNQAILKKRFSFGRPPKSDNIKMSADVASRIPNMTSSQAQLDQAILTLKMVLNLDYDENVTLVDQLGESFKQVNAPELKEKLRNNDPTLKMLGKVVDLNKNIINAKKGSFLPTIAAFGSWNYIGEDDKYNFPDDSLYHVGTVGLMINIPIWNGGEKSAQLQQAVVEKMKAEYQLKKASRGLTLELKTTISNYEALLETYKANKKATELAKRSFAMSQSRFRTGKTSISELNDAELMLTGSKLQQELTLFNIHTTLAKIEQLVATGDEV